MNKNAATAFFLSVLLIICTAPQARAGDFRPGGDADGSGDVTAADARLVLRAAVGLETLPDADFIYADVVPDGLLTAADARMILRAAVGLESLSAPAAPAGDVGDGDPDDARALADALVSEVRDDLLAADMRLLAQEIGVRNWWDGTQNTAAGRLFERMQSLGMEESCLRKLRFTRDGTDGYNLLAVLPAEAPEAEIVVFCAHYDTARGCPGAVDNASGVAVLLELARVLTASGRHFAAELRFLLTAGEEQGYYGAKAYLGALSSEERARHRFVFNIDMAGCPAGMAARALTVCTEPISTDGYVSPAAAENEGSRAVDAAAAVLGLPEDTAYCAPVRAGKHDIVPFRAAGIPALTLSWRTFDASRSEGADMGLAVPPGNHAPSDDLTHFDTASLYYTARLAVYAAALLCQGAGKAQALPAQ